MLFKRWLLAALFIVVATLSYRFSFAIYHQQTVADLSLWQQFYALIWGIRFDMALAMPMALVSLLLHRLSSMFFSLSWHWYVVLWMPLIFIVHTGDTLYFQDSGRHVGYEILAAQGDIFELFQHALHTGLELILWNALLLCALTFLWLKYAKQVLHEKVEQGLVKSFLFSLAILLITVVAIRGGVAGVPQTPAHVYQVGSAQQALVAANPVYIALFILSHKEKALQAAVLPKTSMTTTQMINDLYPEQPGNKGTDVAQTYNIIFILLESWNAVFMQSYNSAAQQQITPNFDAFRARSISSDLTLAGGHRTTEGMFASMCSLQNPLGASVVGTQLMDFTYRCLPQILQDQGYDTAFIQGSYRDTSSVGSFAQKLGFTESLGKVELPKGKLPHNVWGLHDDDLYEYVLDKALYQKKPFFFALNTNSTHDIMLPPHIQPFVAEDVQDAKHKNVMHYADAAFGRFIRKIQQSPLAKNTIIVAFADHTAQVRGSDVYEYMVPMAIWAPDSAAKNIPFATSQRDIAPTVLELLGLPVPQHFTGKSLLSSRTFFADYYHNQHLGWIEGDDLMRLNLSNDSMQCFAWREDLLLKKPKSCEGQESLRQHALGFTNWAQQALFAGETERLSRLSQ